MYQSIDDDHEDYEEASRAGVILPVLLGAVGLAVIGTLVWLGSPGQPAGSGDPVVSAPNVTRAYRQAIAETDPALRRARLTDFVNQNPESDRAAVARAQLSVLDAAESADWEATVAAVYDAASDTPTRSAAVDAFEARWGGYLGGRDAEIGALRLQIEQLAGDAPRETRPDRSLPDQPSPFPSTVPSDTLLGGPASAPPSIAPAPAPVVIAQPAPPSRTAPVITPVRVRRNVTPRYPRAAQRRRINAVVTLRLDIDEKGRVDLAEVVDVEAERYAEEFVKASERAAMRTRFHPKTVDGEPVEAIGVLKRYRFEAGR